MTLKEFSLKILHDLFNISLVTLVIYFIIEIFKPGFVTNYLNLNIFLLLVILTGIIEVIINKKS